MNKEQWIALLQELGLNEEGMRQWHRLFETRHPEAHQSFLEWLGVEAGSRVYCLAPAFAALSVALPGLAALAG
jgi:hypothetical protein